MNLDELHSRLHELGVDVPKNTLKRWGYDDLIPRPQRYKRGKGGGKGPAVSWREETVAEACAVWAIKNALPVKILPKKELIDVIRSAADRVYETPFPSCKISRRGTGTLDGLGGMKVTDEVEIKFVAEDFPGVSLFPGRTQAEQSDTLDALVIAWVCAREKGKKGKSMQERVRVILHWRQDMPRVITIDTPVTLRRVTVEPSDRDEVVPYLNEIDICRLLPILVGSPDTSKFWTDGS